MQVKIEDIVKILLNDKNYEKFDMYYYDQIVAASAFLTAKPKFLFDIRFILKQKTQAEK